MGAAASGSEQAKSQPGGRREGAQGSNQPPPLPLAWLPRGVARRKRCARSTPCHGAKRTNAAFTVSAACMLACCLAPQTAWHGRLGQALWLLCGALGLVRHSGSCAPRNNLCSSPLKLGPKHLRRALGLVPPPRLACSLLGARPGRIRGALPTRGEAQGSNSARAALWAAARCGLSEDAQPQPASLQCRLPMPARPPARQPDGTANAPLLHTLTEVPCRQQSKGGNGVGAVGG